MCQKWLRVAPQTGEIYSVIVHVFLAFFLKLTILNTDQSIIPIWTHGGSNVAVWPKKGTLGVAFLPNFLYEDKNPKTPIFSHQISIFSKNNCLD